MDTNQQNQADSPLVKGSGKRSSARRLSQPFKSPVVLSPVSCDRSLPASSTPKSSVSQRIVISKRFKSTFKSPLKLQDESRVFDSPNKKFKSDSDMATLLKEEEELDKEIKELEAAGLFVGELDRHIEVLHTYNEMKDVTQTVLGRLAELENATVREMHKKYSLPLAD